MRAVVQRVSRARVTVTDPATGDRVVTGEIERGQLVLLGIQEGDSVDDAMTLAEKLVGLRIFEDAEGKMNLALADVGGGMLVVSQFTLLGDCRKGRRPSFIDAARPEVAEQLYGAFVASVRGAGIPVGTGQFRTHMDVELVNDGPVTLLLDSKKQF